eukprot:TRINITY_DN8730_c0_g3_i1.p1 TRINITY_DN8730_c0_g3~~TRINITY_DN8730_c0_g3_i1.p1  ORF type:complete len:342 (+),score=115.12 TRINITY_DN8730_c0_g3_i1:54-1028(+)
MEPERDPPKLSMSALGILTRITLPLWGIIVPIGLLCWLVTLPLKLLAKAYQLVNGGGLPPMRTTFEVRGPDEASAKDVILFVHGWPDSGQLWTKLAGDMASQGFRCIVVTLPGFDGKSSVGWGMDFEGVADELAKVVESEVKAKRVTLFIHDWGCTFGYNLAARYPEMVKRIVSLDVGSHFAMRPAMGLFVASYQLFNLLAFLLGSPGGDVMNRMFLTFSKYSARPIGEARSSVNYPYLRMWLRLIMLRGPPRGVMPTEACPIWYGYALHKPGPFHSNKWLHKLRTTAGCHEQAFKCGHWITEEKYDELKDSVLPWLKAAPGSH